MESLIRCMRDVQENWQFFLLPARGVQRGCALLANAQHAINSTSPGVARLEQAYGFSKFLKKEAQQF